MTLAEWAAGGGTWHFRGHPIFVREGGYPAAPALLLIHGFPTASWDWSELWPSLVARYRVLTLDLLGFGWSAKPAGHRYSLVEQADLCAAWLRARGVHEYHVLAHDYGVSVAQELLARHHAGPDGPALRSIAFLNGGLFPETHRPRPAQRLLLSPLGPLVARLTTKASLARNLRAVFGPDTPPLDLHIDGFWTLLQANDGPRAVPGLIRYIPERRVHRARWVAAMQASPVPLTLIDGAADPVSGAHLVARYRELIPTPDVTVLDRIGHYPQLEAPEAVLSAYQDFRARIDAS